MNLSVPDANDPAPRQHPLSYYSGDAPKKPTSGLAGFVLDLLAVMLAVGFIFAFIDACQINLREAPMNGGGSSYQSSAPCNEQWQRNHPKFANFVRSLPTLGCISLLLLFPYLLTLGALPYAAAIWLAYRSWTLRRHGIAWIVLVVPLAGLLLVLPWIGESMLVIGD